VPRDADTETINAAYARLAKRYSSDAHRDRNVSDLFREIGAVRLKLGEAHEVLSEPSRRADYERSLDRSTGGHREQVPGRAPGVLQESFRLGL
jgi:DnaJ-class molecular chaperone